MNESCMQSKNIKSHNAAALPLSQNKAGSVFHAERYNTPFSLHLSSPCIAPLLVQGLGFSKFYGNVCINAGILNWGLMAANLSAEVEASGVRGKDNGRAEGEKACRKTTNVSWDVKETRGFTVDKAKMLMLSFFPLC